MKVCILVDDVNSWFVEYALVLDKELNEFCDSKLVFKKEDINKGEILFLLSCSQIVENAFLQLNRHNIVVHASDLPSGKGFSPLQWQVLEGKDEICLTLFEATEKVDAGPYYFKNHLELKSTDLLPDMRKKMAEEIISMCIEYAHNYHRYSPIIQKGQESFYSKLTEENHMLDINKTIIEQFNRMRISDNDRFPMWFEIENVRYVLKIYKDASI